MNYEYYDVCMYLLQGMYVLSYYRGSIIIILTHLRVGTYIWVKSREDFGFIYRFLGRDGTEFVRFFSAVLSGPEISSFSKTNCMYAYFVNNLFVEYNPKVPFIVIFKLSEFSLQISEVLFFF